MWQTLIVGTGNNYHKVYHGSSTPAHRKLARDEGRTLGSKPQASSPEVRKIARIGGSALTLVVALPHGAWQGRGRRAGEY